jgi:hypothetical protein
MSSVDPWRKIEEQRALVPDLRSFNETANRPFSVPEVKQIESAIDLLSARINDVFPDVPQKVPNLSVHLESLKSSASKGSGRIDWTNQLVGLMINVLVLLAANQEQARLIWGYIRMIFGGDLFLPGD